MKTSEIVFGTCMAIASLAIVCSLIVPGWRHRVFQWGGGVPMSWFSRIMILLFPALGALLVLRVIPRSFYLLMFGVGIAGFLAQIADARRFGTEIKSR